MIAAHDPAALQRGSSSRGKTDFWEHVEALLGASVPEGQGLKGLWMPGDAPLPGPQAFTFDALHGWWAAEGIPITPEDDAGATNTYPLMRISARDRVSGALLGFTDIVVPVAQETDCRTCHQTGGSGSTRSGVAWSNEADLEKQAKENVLRLHDASRGTALATSQPVLCARCHYSAALDLAGAGPQGAQQVNPTFSAALHGRHAFLGGSADASCYRCHPGAVTRCARGVMADAGLECRDCHGGMEQVAGSVPLLAGGSMDGSNDGAARRPWVDLPRCQSCHTGDALSRLAGTGYVPAADGIRLLQAWRTGDASASPISRPMSRFAENRATSYRFSTGHGGLLCQDCHGSTHAEWSVADPAANDNVAAVQLQGHAGTLSECSACHGSGTLPLSARGPHGMHLVNDLRWVRGGHAGSYERQKSECQACHGVDLRGTALSRTAAARSWTIEDDQTVSFEKGEVVGCTKCHEAP
jgi:hypothetical protein